MWVLSTGGRRWPSGHGVQPRILALWSRSGAVGSWYEPLELWREWADDVQREATDAGHFLPEEAPEETVRRLRAFFAADGRAAAR
jgi:haloacetate dehalogenase